MTSSTALEACEETHAEKGDEPTGTIVVGVDGSRYGDQALRVAVEEARLRRATLRVVHAWHVPEELYLGGFAPTEEERNRHEQEGRTVLEDSIQRAGPPPDVRVEPVLREENVPAYALVAEAEAERADVLVVGSRGLSGFRELILGSVSHSCCRHAPCPVLVVPAPPAANDAPAMRATAVGSTTSVRG